MARPSKALVVALLFTSALALAAGMPQQQQHAQQQQQQQQQVSITDIKRRIDEAVQRGALSSSAGPFAGCSCKQECRDKTQKVCSVRNVVNKVCRTIEGAEDILECTTKCFSAGKAMAAAASAAPSVDLDHVMGGRRLFEAAAAADAEGGAAPREVCREICKPAKMPTSREVCDDVAEKTYECREETVATHCNNVCSCGADVRVVFKQPAIAKRA